MENLHLKNLDLTKVHEQIEKNKLKSILETNNEIVKILDIDDSNDETNIRQPSISHLIAHRFRG